MVMTVYAHLIDNVVRETKDETPIGYPRDFQWIECPAGTQQGATYDPSTKKFTAAILPKKELIFEENAPEVKGKIDPNLKEPIRSPDAPGPAIPLTLV